MKTVIILCAALLSASCARNTHRVSNDDPDFIPRAITVDGVEYKYRVYTAAQYSPSKPERALLFLHGRGECGTDGMKQTTVGLPTQLFIHRDRWPFMVVIPQKHDPSKEWGAYDEVVMTMLDRELREHGIGKDRVAITGLSQGGHGTIELAARHPDRFRAAVAVCGYINPRYSGGTLKPEPVPSAERAAMLARAFESTPIRLFHGGRDSVIPASQSEMLDGILRAAGVDSELTVYPDLDHNSWDRTYNESGIWEWLVQMTE